MKVSHLTVISKESGTASVYVEGKEGVSDLHLIYRDGFAVVNFSSEPDGGARVGVSYPACDIQEIVSVV